MGPRHEDFGFGAWAACCGPGFMAVGSKARRGRSRRFGRRGDLKYVILRLLADKPMHGYEVIRMLEEESGGVYAPSPGSVYPTLQMLEDQGCVVSERADGKRVYRITDDGRAVLKKHGDRAEDFIDQLADLGERFSGAGMGALTRSFVRLAQVSFERATRKTADPDALSRLKEILDQATREMEEGEHA